MSYVSTTAVRVQPAPASHLAAKRAFDIVVGLLTVILTSPLWILIAVLVKLSSPGPVLFRHVRVGRGGQTFVLLKFRTMRDGTAEEVLADAASCARYTTHGFKLPADDPRITPIGRMLRKTSLDELPQLLNVIRGNMSLVGVRPIEELEFEHRRPLDRDVYTEMKPGITGLWQVQGRSKNDYESRLALDRQYVETWSFWRDLVLVLRTPFAVLRIHHTH